MNNLVRGSLAVVLVAACGTSEEPGPACETGKCDGLPFLDQLSGREDPIAQWFRSLAESGVIDDQGIYHGDKAGAVAPADEPLFYTKLTDGLATVQGCDPSALITYALSDDLISGNADQIYPRLIATVCSNDNDKVTNAFIATLGEPGSNPDLNLDDLEMFAWDAKANAYRFYATKDAGDGQLTVEVDPARCAECHETPRDVDPVGMPRLPIMNELTKPWTHWNAGDGGVSESFFIPDSLRGQPSWERYGDTVGAASRLEKVIRDANALRVTPARGKTLFRPAKLEDAMGLIRPLFCDEQLNYVSELATGELSTDAVVAGGIKNAFRAVQPTWPWDWFNNDNLVLPPSSEDQRLFIMPVRGVAEVTFEAQLQSALSPTHILAVRALDWKKAAFSDFRCNLWRDAWTAFQAEPPALTGRNRDAVKVLFEEIMKRGGMSTRGLASGTFIAIADATPDAVQAAKDAIAAGTVPATCEGGFCEVDANGFGTAIDGYVQQIVGDRDALRAERDRRACKLRQEVEPAGAHNQFGTGQKINNDPSFLRLPTDGSAGVSTFPLSCP